MTSITEQAEALEKAMREVEQEPDLVKKGLIVAAVIQQLRHQAEETKWHD